MNRYHCPSCHKEYDIAEQVLGRLGGIFMGGLAGGATRNPFATLAGVVGGFLIGREIDKSVIPRCPECGALLELVELVGEAYS